MDATSKAVALAQRTRPRRESAIQREVLRALPALGIIGWRNNTGAVTVTRQSTTQSRHIRFGVRGSADILGLMKGSGRFVAVEVKCPGQRLRPSQVAWMGLIRGCGGLALTVTSVEDLWRQLHSDCGSQEAR